MFDQYNKAVPNPQPRAVFKAVGREARQEAWDAIALLDGPYDPEKVAEAARGFRRASDKLRSFLKGLEASDG